jgi:hypothetical protein
MIWTNGYRDVITISIIKKLIDIEFEIRISFAYDSCGPRESRSIPSMILGVPDVAGWLIYAARSAVMAVSCLVLPAQTRSKINT